MNNKGEVNLSAIAKECGFERQVLYKTLKSQLAEDLAELGLDNPGDTKSPEDRLSKKADQKAKEASSLRKELDAKVQENSQLRAQIEELEKQLSQLRGQKSEETAAMEEMVMTGRRCFVR